VVRVAASGVPRLFPERPTPERCVEAYYLQRTRFESIAEPKLRGRQLTEDWDVEISAWVLPGSQPLGSVSVGPRCYYGIAPSE
jgi:hypothetical protein